MKRLFFVFAIFCVLLLVSCSAPPNKITVEYIAGEGGTIVGEAIQTKEGDTATFNQVTATADKGYKFVKWSDGKIEPSRIDTLTESTTITAKFERIGVITVDYFASEGGIVTGEASQAKVFYGDPITFNQVTAVASEGYKFLKWSDGKTEATRFDSLTESASFTAIFEAIPYVTVNYVSTEGGTIIGEHTQKRLLENGGAVFTQVVATAQKGYKFIGWDDGHTSPFRADTLSQDATFTAIFEIDPSVKISYTASEGGYIEGECEQVFEMGPATSTSVTAVASEGYRFTAWDDGNTSPTRNDVCEESTSFVAIFIKVHTVTFSANLNGNTLIGKTTQTLDHGKKTSSVIAQAGFGYRFVGWSNGERSPILSVTAEQSCNYEAIFEYSKLSLPIISINTINNEEIISKDEYLDCFVDVLNTDDEYLLSFESARIKGRGNSTWEYDKKPYRLKFESGVNLFGNGKAKDWTLITNHSDLSLMRNFLAQSIASVFSCLNATTSTQYVELYLNGEYVGVYLVCEHIEVQENRVNITESDGTGDSFLIELDGRQDGTSFEVNGKHYVIKSPDTDSELYTDECAEQIKAYLTDCFNAIWAKDWDRVCSLMDVESFAQCYIVFEIFKNPDVGWSSFYLHKDVDGKLRCGPAWDFDRSLGVVGNTTAAKPYNTLWSREQNPWFNNLFRFAEFEELVSEILRESIPAIEAVINNCYKYVYENRDSFDRNFVKWDILEEGIWPNDDELNSLGTWDKHVEYTKEYLNNSLDYLISIYL